MAYPYLRLKHERLRRNLTQDQLALKAGISQSTLSNFERRRMNPTEEELVRLANALLITPPRVLLQECKIADPAPEPDEELV